MDESKAIKTIFNYFGEKNQVLKLLEELGELSVEIRNNPNIINDNFCIGQCSNFEEIIAEMTDVSIVIDQFLTHYGRDLYDTLRTFKINRTLERIKKT
ncbi:MAG: hypothetical protein GY756_09875 [bacterium]|nr:hypothetical protein [bacterium]